MSVRMSPAEAFAFLDSFHNLETSRRFACAADGLARVRELMRRAGIAQPYPVVHVAGSKGKGSVCECVARSAAAAGYRVGVYMSPHVYAFGERIRVVTDNDGEGQIPATAFAAQVAALREHAEALRGVGLTYFEIVTAAALRYFAQERVDLAVIEVGLGGRLDATNVVSPAVCVITDIALEHTDVLGTTIAEIAREKAGIVKRGVPLIATAGDAESSAVFARVCREREAPLSRYGIDFDEGPYASAFAGVHQACNTAAAVCAVRSLSAQGIFVRDDAIRRGLAAVRLPARFEVVAAHGKTRVYDMAHTAASVAGVRAEAERRFADKRIGYLFGCRADKDAAGMRDALRGCEVLDLCGADWAKLDDAAVAAFEGRCDVLVVTGSAYLCAAVRSLSV